MAVRRLIALLLTALVVGGCAGQPLAPPSPPQAHADIFYDAQLFFRGLAEAEQLPPAKPAGVVLGGLAPHHNLAGSMYSRFYLPLQERPPATILIVGPNHDNRGARIVTGRQPWTTAFGQVEVDQALVDRLVAADLAVVDDGALAPEHSVGSHMPYVKYHAPKARVVPLILHKDVSMAEIARLAEFFAPLLGPELVLLASVDFSHYLTRAEAEAKDEVTLKSMRAHDLPGLYRMGPDHLDSPASLGLLLLAMQQRGLEQPEILGHTNSGVIIGSDLIETTSYFTFLYQSPR